MKKWYIYILTNQKNWTLYIWVTSDLIKRVNEHKNKVVEWFTKKYNLDKLVYYEICDDITQAIQREKQLKWLLRSKKLELIEKDNIDWYDLSNDIL